MLGAAGVLPAANPATTNIPSVTEISDNLAKQLRVPPAFIRAQYYSVCECFIGRNQGTVLVLGHPDKVQDRPAR
jgi:hypothetical protein